MQKFLTKGRKKYQPLKPLLAIVFYIVSRIAGRNLKNHHQVAIYAFDNIGMIINLYGRYERESLDLLADTVLRSPIIDPSGVVIDIGANIGNHSIFFSDFCNKVYAFEPNPAVYKLLLINSEKFNIIPINIGISDRNCNLLMGTNKINIGGSRVINDPKAVASNDKIEISVRRLDDLEILAQQKITLIKIDVEGHEINVLTGAADLIKTQHPVIVFEQCANEINNGTSKAIEALRDLGYSFYVVENNFYFGEGFFARLISVGLRTIFGYRRELVRCERFNPKFYEMIVAIWASPQFPGNHP